MKITTTIKRAAAITALCAAFLIAGSVTANAQYRDNQRNRGGILGTIFGNGNQNRHRNADRRHHRRENRRYQQRNNGYNNNDYYNSRRDHRHRRNY